MSKLTWVQVINKHLKIFVYFFYLKSFLDSKEYEINRNNPTSTEQLDLHMLKLILLGGIYLFYYTSILLFYIMRHLIGSRHSVNGQQNVVGNKLHVSPPRKSRVFHPKGMKKPI